MESVQEHYTSMMSAIRRFAPYVDIERVDAAYHLSLIHI